LIAPWSVGSPVVPLIMESLEQRIGALAQELPLASVALRVQALQRVAIAVYGEGVEVSPAVLLSARKLAQAVQFEQEASAAAASVESVGFAVVLLAVVLLFVAVVEAAAAVAVAVLAPAGVV